MLVVTLTVTLAATGVLPASAATKKAAKPSAVEPAALKALDQMGAYLRTLTEFQVEAITQKEEVLDNGLKVQFQGVVSLTAQKPDRLMGTVTSDRQERQYLYNGKEFTLWAPRVKYYATVPAPPTISKLIDALQEKFGIEMPLVDLFRWGTEPSRKEGITVAMDVDPGTIGGTLCEHYAYRQKGLDWQIWIQKGDKPLPRKLVITTTTDEARPQYQVTYTWNLEPAINDADFTFDPPADAQRIIFNQLTPKLGASKKGK